MNSARVTVQCQRCAKRFERYPSQIQAFIFCTVNCKILYRKEHRADFFWAHVDKTGECWLWQGYADKDGYGRFGVDYKVARASRMAWELTFGDIPPEFQVCHNCPGGDNPACVNPAHLWLGRTINNIHDAMRKNRRAIGERHPRTLLTEEDAMGILALKGVKSQKEIAHIYNTSRYVVGDIHTGLTWKHLQRHDLKDVSVEELGG